MRIIKPASCLIHDIVFQKSIIDYNIMLKLIEDETAVFLQSGKELLAIMSSGSSKWLWLWVDPDITPEKKNVLFHELYNYTTESLIKNIFGYAPLVKDFSEVISIKKGLKYKINTTLNVYYCPTMIIEDYNYKIIKAEETHLNAVSNIYSASHSDTSKKQADEFAQKLIKQGCVYLLKVGNDYVSMANITHISSGYARINSVYTPIHERCKGYATDLMAQLCIKLLRDNLTPVLYTEENNFASNTVYRKVGFIKTGQIVSANLIE